MPSHTMEAAIRRVLRRLAARSRRAIAAQLTRTAVVPDFVVNTTKGPSFSMPSTSKQSIHPQSMAPSRSPC
jgi:hypothetical protein